MRNCKCLHNSLITFNKGSTPPFRPSRITLNSSFKSDPTRTKSIRTKFIRDLTKRFNELKKVVIESIIKNDCFGLEETSGLRMILMELTPLPNKAFAFKTDEQKIEGFMTWLKEQEEKGIIELTERPGARKSEGLPYNNLYIRRAYRQGVVRARLELKKKGYNVETVQISEPGVLPIAPGMPTSDALEGILEAPFHADRIANIYTRVYSDLDGITNAMDQQITRVLSEGLLLGHNPKRIASSINKVIDKIGLNRAKTLARTEVVRAHHLATIAEYRQWGADEVEVQAEFLTAGYGVCPKCKELAKNGPYTLDQIEGMIPVHPNCRCCAIPVRKKDEDEEKKSTSKKKKKGSSVKRKKKAKLSTKQEEVKFKPARNLSEAEDEHLKYHFNTPIWGRDISDKNKLKILNHINREAQRMSKYNILSVKRAPLEIRSILNKRYAGLCVSMDDVRTSKITLNTARLRLLGSAPRGKVKWNEKRFTFGNAELLSVYRHETGHAIYYHYENKKHIKEFKKAWDKIGTDKISKKVSQYASSKVEEFFAEAMSIYTYKNFEKGTMDKALDYPIEKILNKFLSINPTIKS